MKTVVACLGLTMLVVAGCGDDTATSTTGGGLGCEAANGCPSVVSDCIAFADNTGKDRVTLRITQLSVTEPLALTDVTVATLLAKGVTIDQPSCQAATGDAIFTGDGTFSWILEFDKTAGTLRTGGAQLQTDPAAGYCFVNETIGGFAVAPFTTSAPLGSDGTFATMGTRAVNVPIFTDPGDASKVIMLPLRGVSLFDGKVSADGNCIGSYNAQNLDPANLCKPEASTPTFVDGASLKGHITLEEADAVTIPELGGRTLCWLLAGAEEFREGSACKRDANMVITYQGNWCTGVSPDDEGAAAGCADSVILGATLAASGATLRSDCGS